MREDWLSILNRVKTGELSVEEGSRYLEALETPLSADASASRTLEPEAWQGAPADWQAVAESETSAGAEVPPVVEDAQPDLGWWKEAWLIPFWVGTGILVLSAILMGWAYSGQRFFWFYCSWVPLLLGLLAILLGWWSRQARWLHVRIQDSGGSRIAISLPLPLRFAGWALGTFGHFIPQLHDTDLTDMPVIFSTLAEAEGPLTVEVDDKGDRVRVYIL